MIAFTIFGRPVYRYGIFYGVTFLFGYLFLSFIGKQVRLANYPRLQKLLTVDLDTVSLLVVLGVVLGGRLGHVFLYEWSYYQNHLGEIMQTRQGGMSFIGGVAGVIAMLLIIKWKYKLTSIDFLLLGDLILCIVPLGILLGRIGNYLNQELYGRVVSNKTLLSSVASDRLRELKDGILFLDTKWYQALSKLHLIADYQTSEQFPGELRVNTNFIQAFAEGFLLLVIGQSMLRWNYVRQHIRPGLISGIFLIGYGVMRFFIEYLKALPEYEMWGYLSVSQWIMLLFVVTGITVISKSRKV